MKVKLLLLFLICFGITLHAQERVTTFGIVVKPVFPSSYFRTGPKTSTNNNVQFKITQTSGFSAGALVRYGINKTLSIESGISYVKRLYDLEIKDSSFTGTSDYKIIGYEIPLQALAFIQLSKQLWMNAALGPSLDIFPSDVRTSASYFVQETRRKNERSIAKAGVIANLGWELRTQKSGYFYLGSSYHRSLTDIYTTYIAYVRNPKSLSAHAVNITPLSGDYLSIDLRYYFHENPRNKKPGRE